MKKIIFAFLLIFAALSSLSAEQISEVTLRFSHQDNTIRIVLESDRDTIEKANTIASLSDLKIEFPSQFILKKQKNFIFEMFKHNRLLIINLRDILDVKVFKLESPPRIVVDLKAKPKADYKPDQALINANTVNTAVIDAGHGGFDFGLPTDSKKEKDMNLVLASNLRTALSGRKISVFLTRETDRAVPIADRINFSNSKKPDIFISLHATRADRFFIYTSPVDEINADLTIKLYSQKYRQSRYTEQSRMLAFAVGTSIKSDLGIEVALRELPLPVLNAMDAPAVLIEYPLSLVAEGNRELIDKLINAVIEGIAAYEL